MANHLADNSLTLIVVAFTGAGVLGCLAIAGILLVGGQVVPDWLVAVISAAFGGGLAHVASQGGGSQ